MVRYKYLTKKPPAFANGLNYPAQNQYFASQGGRQKPSALSMLFYVVIAPGIDSRGSI